MNLTADNYYSAEANEEFWSASLVKNMLCCPAAALAELRGEWHHAPSISLLVGSYVDAHFEGTLADFKAEHPEILKKDGTPKAEYLKANQMIARAEQDPVFMEYMQGEKQVILTGYIEGYPFKAKLDVYLPGQRIVDLKTAKDLEPLYDTERGRLHPAEYWRWDLQMAIYYALEGHGLETDLAIITKQDPPALKLINIEDYRREAQLKYLAEVLPELDAMKQGIIPARRCERCAYCRATERMTAPVPLGEYDII